MPRRLHYSVLCALVPVVLTGQQPRPLGSPNAEFKEPLYSAPPLLARMVDAGLLGRKSGRGFHTYS